MQSLTGSLVSHFNSFIGNRAILRHTKMADNPVYGAKEDAY